MIFNLTFEYKNSKMDKEKNYTSMPSLTKLSTNKISTIKNIPSIGLDAPKKVQFKIS